MASLPSPHVCLCHFCDNHGPTVVLACTKRASTDVNGNISQDNLGSCDSCRSLEADQGFIVTPMASEEDATLPMVYASCNASQLPETALLLLRRAAMRCLSLESTSASSTNAACSPGRPVVFGDQEWLAMAATFRVSDGEHVRGFKRTYGLVLMVPGSGRQLLLRSMPAVESAFNAIAVEVKRAAAETFEKEGGGAAESHQLQQPQQQHPLLAQAPQAPPPPYKQPRNLNALAGKGVYAFLHAQFVTLLCSLTNSCGEEGLCAKPTETKQPVEGTAARLKAALDKDVLKVLIVCLLADLSVKIKSYGSRDCETSIHSIVDALYKAEAD